MDSRTREDITAATAVHRELGPGYDDAVAESLVERIGTEVDKRVDARLAQRNGPPPAPVTQAATSARSQWPPVVLALGSMLAGVGATAAAMASHTGHDSGPVVATVFIWIAIAIINIAYSRRR